MSAYAAAEAAIRASGVDRIYAMGAVPASPAYPYLVLDAGFDRATTYTLEAAHSVGEYRVTTQSFGRTRNSARGLDDLARLALLDRRLPVAGLDCGPCLGQVLGAIVRDPDALGVIGVTSTYLFATTKEAL